MFRALTSDLPETMGRGERTRSGMTYEYFIYDREVLASRHSHPHFFDTGHLLALASHGSAIMREEMDSLNYSLRLDVLSDGLAHGTQNP